MELNLLGKVAIVGGSSKGIGKGCAVKLAQEGAHVVLCARHSQALRETENHIKSFSKSKVLAIPADLSKMEDVRKVVAQTIQEFKKIDILVTNSGGPKPGSFFELTDNDWQDAYQSVFFYVVEFYKQVIPIMVSQGFGRIINITSLTVKEPSERLILSNVFRTGVVSMAKTLSKDLVSKGVTINNICPGSFKTDRAMQLMSDRAQKENKTVEQIEASIVQALPAKRFNTVDEIGGLVAYLASDSAKGITGTTIQLDGGASSFLF
jgi:3-oxoacyl-[acyl-carrier protein] reductase